MSALPVNSPIQRLDFDILWCIIMINADIFSNHRALETTLATSRVCRDWRNFMLNTSSIWAHLIDLGRRPWWILEGRRELIRRNGTAKLWIKVPNLDGFTLRWAKIILSVVAENWQRIQKLEVTIGYKHVDQWPLLYLPAPHLDSFGITFKQELSDFNHKFSSLFGGNAPMLRELRFSGHRSDFTARPSWLHQLRSLDLSVKLTVSETLEVLLLTKNLVNLRLDRTVADNTISTHPLVSLPNLAHVDLNLIFKLTPGAVLLDRMCIPPACTLAISVCSLLPGETDNKNNFAPIIRVISTCAQRHLSHHVPQQLDLTIMTRQFILETATRIDEPTFKFCMELAATQMFPEHMLTILLRELSLPSFSTVTSFHCRINGMNGPVPGFIAFMACLPAVKAVTTDKLSLRHLRGHSALQGENTGPTFGFPALKILKLINTILTFRSDSSQSASAADPVSKFVMARIRHGHAISILDFTSNIMNVLPDMVILRKAVGLKVRWRQRGAPNGGIREYMCGTGSAQNLGPV